MSYFLGMDIGSASVKLALIDDSGVIVHLDHRKITSSAQDAAGLLIDGLGNRIDLDQIAGAGVSGSGKDIISQQLNWEKYSSPLAAAAGLLHSYPEARTIIQIGGQTSLIIRLEDGLNTPWNVVSNPLCAAGTGRFLEQQAYRLGITLEEFSNLAMLSENNPPRIAARCSVFAKSDLIHLQQKGVSLESMLYALCESIARMVTSLNKGTIDEPVFFIGGVAANAAIGRALTDIISARNDHAVNLTIPDNSVYTEAIGAALLSRGHSGAIIALPSVKTGQQYLSLPSLQYQNADSPAIPSRIEKTCSGYLGVDVGSTSTKAVIIDSSGKVIAKHYLMTAGRPVDAVKEVFRNLIACGADMVDIRGAGVTGSGRYLVGSLIGADLIKNEITAQTRAAGLIDDQADIIEIGGQDSKLVIKRNGVVVDYQMNKACAAGTGSFIDELAEMMGVSVKDGNFARLAFAAPHTIDLGTRCAAFMGQAVASAQREGVPVEVITASLANSIAKNYLSKVVGHRKLGKKIILTGAVFHNGAVISAFRQQLEDKELIVADHREVTGAIGAALLARESNTSSKSRFKGFSEVIGTEHNLSTFTCKHCDNNCTITRMVVPGEKPTFYGSRCDYYDSTSGQERMRTSFDDREEALFKELQEKTENSSALTVGIPRALIIHDLAPLMIAFLNELGVNIVLSGKTSKAIIEHSVELSHTDTCFPVKLLHGHAASLKDSDYVLYPCAIRLGQKDGDENQKYACPLVQASPFIIKQAIDLKDRMLTPIIDFSQGRDEVIRNLADTAVQMGFNKSKGMKAARAGLKAQDRFEQERSKLGENLLRQIHENGSIGVVLFSRSYMSQDQGANMGIAEKLAQFGVVPVPLDYLPLMSIDPKQFSDRPYWFYETKLLAAAAITAADPQLYGLILTNFGCGPNSFILRVVEDIMGDKPLGQLEIDEHAAEAGIVTRLEAFVDTITGFSDSAKSHKPLAELIYRGSSPTIGAGKTLLVPRMSPHAEVVAASMQAYGVNAEVLPESDERSLLYANQLTTGTECLPYRVCLGDFVRYYKDNGGDSTGHEAFMAGSYGPCRLGKYSIEQMRILREMNIDLPVRTSVSNTAYRDLNLGKGFERRAWAGIVFIDYLQKLVWRTRPYEKEPGKADRLFDEYLAKAVASIRKNGFSNALMQEASSSFQAIMDHNAQRKPLVGINGEIFLRANQFSNSNLVRVCEEAGLEVVVSPMGEWFKYTSYRNLEDAITDRKLKKSLISHIKKVIQELDERKIASRCQVIEEKDTDIATLLALSAEYLSPRCGSEAVLSLGSGIEWMENPRFAGVISVMPHGCMPGGIVAAMSDKFSSTYHKPWISLTYDGFMETNNLAKINNFAEILKYCKQDSAQS